MPKYLRIAVTVLSLTACVMLIALWVRSYCSGEIVDHTDSSRRLTMFGSTRGTLYAIREDLSQGVSGEVHDWRYTAHEPVDTPNRFYWRFSARRKEIQLPHLFLILFFLATAASPCLGRFSLRALLIAMTVVAVVLGIIVAVG